MTKKKDSPVKLLLQWAKKDRIYLICSSLLSFISGIRGIFPYYCVYKIIDITLVKNAPAKEFYPICAILLLTILI